MKRTVEWSQYQGQDPYESVLAGQCFEVEKRARLAFDPFLSRQIPFRYLTKPQWQDISKYSKNVWDSRNGSGWFPPSSVLVYMAEWSRPRGEFTKERALPRFVEEFEDWNSSR
jgi:hypothetical protein